MDDARNVFFHLHPDPMWVFDIATLQILDVNQAAIVRYGYSREDFLAMNLDTIALPDERPSLRSIINSRPAGLAGPFLARHLLKSGQIISVQISGHAFQHDGRQARLICARDVTRLVELEHERERGLAREAAARRSSELIAHRFQTLFAAIPGKFMVLTPGAFEILAASDSYLASINCTREKLIGRSLFDTFSAEQREAAPRGEHELRASLDRVMSTRRPDAMAAQAFPVRLDDGGLEVRHWCAVNAPVLDASGEITYIFHKVEDVTSLMAHGEVDPQDIPALLDPPAALELALRSRALQDRTQRLEATVAELRKAHELLAMATWTLDFTTSRLTVSESFHPLLGTTPESFTPALQGYLELVHPDDRESMRVGLVAFEQAGARHYQVRQRVIRPDDGRILYLMVVGEFHRSAAGATLTCILQDVTSQFEAAQELNRVASLARLAGRTARLGGWRYDVASKQVEWDTETFAIAGLPQGATLKVDQIIALYAPEYRAGIREAFERCQATGEPFNQLVQFDARQGRMWVRVIGEAEFDQQGRVTLVQGAFQDVDENIRAQHAAQDLSRRLVQTLESISDAFFTLDRKWRFTYLNSQAERILNRTRASLLNRVVWDEFGEAAGTAFQTQYERVMYNGETVRFDQDYAPLGARFRVNAYPVPEGVAVYFSDTTNEHRQSELARINDERFQLIAKATNDVVWDWDLASNTLWWNENLTTLFGYAPDAMRSGVEFWSGCVHPEDRDAVIESLETAIAGTTSTWTAEYRLMHADGTPHTVIDRGFLIRDENGRAVRMVGSVLDISERLQLDAQLRQSQKLEAIGYLTGGLAHDFNNLLTVILGNAAQLGESLENDPGLRELATMTEAAAQRGAQLTQRLLAFSRRQALNPKVIDINALVAGLAALFRRTLPENIELKVSSAPDLWAVEVDPGQLELTLLNLVVNARDAMSDGGELVIETGNTRLDVKYARQHHEVVPGEYVMVAVRDTGAGIAPGLLSRVFDPFFTTKGNGKGSGLGLSMVYGFVKQSRGHIRLSSVEGQGTTVMLLFPRVLAAAKPLAAPADSPTLPVGHEHILVVEDNNAVREHVVAQLQGLGYQVTSARSGQQALDLLPDLPDIALLFTDVVMPGGMNGKELAQRVRSLRPEVKILYTSGYTGDLLVPGGPREPEGELLPKPYRRRELAEKIRRVLDDRS